MFEAWFSSFGFNSASDHTELPDIFPLGVDEALFVETEVTSIYAKILTDVVERSEGLSSDEQVVLWDNCLASERNDGLVSLLSKAMFRKDELFLVYDKSTNVLRTADNFEVAQIKADYKAYAESSVGTYISFKNFSRNDMIKLYSSLEYCTVGGLNKTMNISKAVQIKVSDLRASVGLNDSEKARAQVLEIANALKKGRDVYMDSKDILESANPSIDPIKASMELLNEKRAFYLNMPASYITGILNGGLGDSGAGDARAIERGLKSYFFPIIKPVCKAIFGKDLSFKSEDFALLSGSLEALKIFELVGDDLISRESKIEILNKLLGIDASKSPPPQEIAPLSEPIVPTLTIGREQNA